MACGKIVSNKFLWISFSVFAFLGVYTNIASAQSRNTLVVTETDFQVSVKFAPECESNFRYKVLFIDKVSGEVKFENDNPSARTILCGYEANHKLSKNGRSYRVEVKSLTDEDVVINTFVSGDKVSFISPIVNPPSGVINPPNVANPPNIVNPSNGSNAPNRSNQAIPLSPPVVSQSSGIDHQNVIASYQGDNAGADMYNVPASVTVYTQSTLCGPNRNYYGYYFFNGELCLNVNAGNKLKAHETIHAYTLVDGINLTALFGTSSAETFKLNGVDIKQNLELFAECVTTRMEFGRFSVGVDYMKSPVFRELVRNNCDKENVVKAADVVISKMCRNKGTLTGCGIGAMPEIADDHADAMRASGSLVYY